ncbi:hypothetical protein [Prevotella intermedia]|uniref:hypothetical protein n=1 Tax=Prevotella intermedia TaxID=28131 RepID=UPI0012FD856D|nr:hypothetical protein [Prevotella intermedia]
MDGISPRKIIENAPQSGAFSFFVLVFYLENLGELEILKPLSKHHKPLQLSKNKIFKKRQLRFGVAKVALLQRKRAAFTLQNLRFWNAKQ